MKTYDVFSRAKHEINEAFEPMIQCGSVDRIQYYEKGRSVEVSVYGEINGISYSMRRSIENVSDISEFIDSTRNDIWCVYRMNRHKR